jgi:hypothetical protein
MRRAGIALALLLSVGAGAAMAASETAPGRLGGMGANLFGNSFFHFGEPNLEAFPVSSIRAGKLRIELQRTRLADVQRAFGGTIYEEKGAHWLCYATPQAATWFMSNSLGGGEFIMMVAAQAGPAAGSCDPAPAGFAIPDFGVPGLGASAAELKTRFGAAPLGSHSDVSYRVDRPSKDGLGTANDAQYLGYVVKGGRVVGLGVGETTTQ